MKIFERHDRLVACFLDRAPIHDASCFALANTFLIMSIHSQPKAISLSIDPGVVIRSKDEAFENRHSILMWLQDVNLHESRDLEDAAYMYHVKGT